MALRNDLADGEEEVHRNDDVVHLRKDGVAAIDHGVRSQPLLGELGKDFGLEAVHDLVNETLVGEVARGSTDLSARELPPPCNADLDVGYPGERLRTELFVPCLRLKLSAF